MSNSNRQISTLTVNERRDRPFITQRAVNDFAKLPPKAQRGIAISILAKKLSLKPIEAISDRSLWEGRSGDYRILVHRDEERETIVDIVQRGKLDTVVSQCCEAPNKRICKAVSIGDSTLAAVYDLLMSKNAEAEVEKPEGSMEQIGESLVSAVNFLVEQQQQVEVLRNDVSGNLELTDELVSELKEQYSEEVGTLADRFTHVTHELTENQQRMQRALDQLAQALPELMEASEKTRRVQELEHKSVVDSLRDIKESQREIQQRTNDHKKQLADERNSRESEMDLAREQLQSQLEAAVSKVRDEISASSNTAANDVQELRSEMSSSSSSNSLRFDDIVEQLQGFKSEFDGLRARVENFEKDSLRLRQLLQQTHDETKRLQQQLDRGWSKWIASVFRRSPKE